MAVAAAGASTPFNSCCRHPPLADVFSPMERPCSTSSSNAAAPGNLLRQLLLQQQQHLDIFDYLSDVDQCAAPAAVPGAFMAPPAMASAEPVVPDAASVCFPHPRSVAAAMAGEGRARTTPDRIAFRTRSDDEILDDGYKWRKYGKKSVKNSPNPRNYYRCSTEGCNVKKRVERDMNDPSYVVTMYEGIHNHVSPGTVYYATQDAASGRFFVAGMHHTELN